MSVKKTLAMKLLEGKKIQYEALSYPDTLSDAQEVAQALGAPPHQVFKTLVVRRTQPGKSILAMVPADRQLDLKKLAAASREKKLRMAAHHEAEQLTGLKVGGISALALTSRPFDVFLDWSALALEQIVISAGERGQQIKLRVDDLVQLSGARAADIAGDVA